MKSTKYSVSVKETIDLLRGLQAVDLCVDDTVAAVPIPLLKPEGNHVNKLFRAGNRI